MRNKTNSDEKKNDLKCREIKSRLQEMNSLIRSREDEIQSLKDDIKAYDNKRRILRSEMKNKMTKYGVSLDFIADSFVPNPYLGIAKGASDLINAPSAREIEEMMRDIESIEKDIEDKKREIMRVGVKVREFVYKREDLVRDWRYSGCRT